MAAGAASPIGGSDAAEQVVFGVPPSPRPGPSSVRATFAWHCDAMSSLDEDERRNLDVVLKRLRFSSHYSGMGSLEQISDKLGFDKSASEHACDIGKQTLLAWS